MSWWQDSLNPISLEMGMVHIYTAYELLDESETSEFEWGSGNKGPILEAIWALRNDLSE